MVIRRIVVSSRVPFVVLCLQLNLAAQQPPPVEAEIATAPVVLDGVELFRVRGVSSVSAEERASHIEEQIRDVASDRKIAVESLRIVDTDMVSRIQAGDRVIVGTVDADAKLEQVDRRALATAHLYRLRQAITDYRVERTAAALRNDVIAILAATIVLAIVLLVMVWLWRWANRATEARLGKIHGVGIQSFEVIRAERIWDAVRGMLVAIRAAVVLVIVLIWLGYGLGRFPWTRGLSSNMSAFVLGPVQQMSVAIIQSTPKLVFLAVLFVVVRIALRVVRLFFSAVEHRSVTLARFNPEWAQPTYKIVRIAVIAFGLIIAYPYIPGSSSPAFQGVSLFVGLLFSLGSSSVISNIVAGYAMIYRRAFKVGDRIKVGTAVGDVVETRLQVTHLRTVKNEEIIIPNSQILSTEVLNYSSLAENGGVILHTEVGIGYETPWQQVEALLIEAARRTSGFGTDPRPYVLEKELGTFAVVYELNVFCTNVQMMGRLYSALHRNILDVFNEYGVQIMTPAYEGDPSAPKVVPPKQWYSPPAEPPPDVH